MDLGPGTGNREPGKRSRVRMGRGRWIEMAARLGAKGTGALVGGPRGLLPVPVAAPASLPAPRLLLAELHPMQVRVQPATRQQFGVGALLHQPALVEDQHLVG